MQTCRQQFNKQTNSLLDCRLQCCKRLADCGSKWHKGIGKPAAKAFFCSRLSNSILPFAADNLQASCIISAGNPIPLCHLLPAIHKPFATLQPAVQQRLANWISASRSTGCAEHYWLKGTVWYFKRFMAPSNCLEKTFARLQYRNLNEKKHLLGTYN